MNDEITLKMHEDYCCGGGHCGIMPGYDFVCPECNKDTYIDTGDPLEIGNVIKCYKCGSIFKVLSKLPDVNFIVKKMVIN